VKQQKALELVATLRPLALPWQVGCEFVAASRKLVPFGFGEADAWAALENMQDMADAVFLPDRAVWVLARDLHQHRQFSFWDAMLVAACIRGGATNLYTEDLHAGATVEQLAIRNPFA
jgi:predicted nucleic acid-binding protein